MNEWNIQSRAHACEACSQPFADQQAYRTILFEDGKELRRSDICESCAQKAGDPSTRAGFISQWHGVYEAPPAHPVEAIQKETAETVLRKLIEQNEPRYAPAAGAQPKETRGGGPAQADQKKRAAFRARRVYSGGHARTQTHPQGQGTA